MPPNVEQVIEYLEAERVKVVIKRDEAVRRRQQATSEALLLNQFIQQLDIALADLGP